MIRRLSRWLGRLRFRGPQDYWERRYARGGTSGPGSYGVLAEYKAGLLNDLVRRNDIQTVVEFGCGDGQQVSLADYPDYTGLDVSASAIERCRRRFADDPDKRFCTYDPESPLDALPRGDLTLSLDVIYHLVDDRVFDRHLDHLFGVAERFVAVYSSDHARNDPLQPAHVRHRHFTPTVAERFPDWQLHAHLANPLPFTGDLQSGSHSDFFIYRRLDAR